MSQKKYLVTLTADERDHLDDLLRTVKASALVQTRARILLKADQTEGGPASFLTTLPSFRFATGDVIPRFPFQRDIEIGLVEALARSRNGS